VELAIAECSGYFNDVLIVVKLLLSWVPTPCTAVMIAMAIPAAIRPYSIAVAPDSSLKNVKMRDFMGSDLVYLSSEPSSFPRLPSVELRLKI
jgi:hypothetical protein